MPISFELIPSLIKVCTCGLNFLKNIEKFLVVFYKSTKRTKKYMCVYIYFWYIFIFGNLAN